MPTPRYAKSNKSFKMILTLPAKAKPLILKQSGRRCVDDTCLLTEFSQRPKDNESQT